MWSTQLQRWWSGLHEDIPEPLAPPDSYDDAEIAAMLRELGIALVEVVQPTQLVRNRLLNVARRYTTKPVRVVVLPTVLLIQLGSDNYEVDATTRATTQLTSPTGSTTSPDWPSPGPSRRPTRSGRWAGPHDATAVQPCRHRPRLRHHHDRLQHDHQPHVGIVVGARVPRPDRRRHRGGGPARSRR